MGAGRHQPILFIPPPGNREITFKQQIGDPALRNRGHVDDLAFFGRYLELSVTLVQWNSPSVQLEHLGELLGLRFEYRLAPANAEDVDGYVHPDGCGGHAECLRRRAPGVEACLMVNVYWLASKLLDKRRG
jgi:hypothetical protein